MTVACACKGAICGMIDDRVAVRTYECAGCKREVPWCFGAADDEPDLCDDCWGVLYGPCHAETAALPR